MFKGKDKEYRILGIVNVAQGEMKPLPVIGGITIIK